MAILSILNFNNPILRQKAKRVRTVDGSLQKLIGDMVDTMRAANGVGLAAPQVGISLRVAVIQTSEEEEEEVIVLINPEIVKRSGTRLVGEGCLSLPGYKGEIPRSLSVTVKARDRQGKEFRIKGADLLAQALEHEIDHLNGTLFFDHLDSLDKLQRIESRPPAAPEETLPQ
ncbi:MAG: peptide deformylase [Chloroflexi bacterium]|nr:peptide deformylase [Chloroflexota bacterium]